MIDGGLSRRQSRAVLTAGILFNICLLGYFKYAGFLVANADHVFGLHWAMPNIILPIGISFITFQKIAFLVDAYRGLVRNFTLLNYSFFVSFFPQLIAGPITHHSEIMPQIGPSQRRDFAADLAVGFSIFVVGLFKKVVIADSLAIYADAGYATVRAGHPLDSASAWITVLCYSFQLYYDFSGYSDMAVGLARMFGFELPVNFYSPYKASSIIDFWWRWHITLSRFLRDYLYIPLGGNRHGPREEVPQSRRGHAARRVVAWRQLDVRDLGRCAWPDARREPRMARISAQPPSRLEDTTRRRGCRPRDIHRRDTRLDLVPIGDVGGCQDNVCLALADDRRSIGLAVLLGPVARPVHGSHIRVGADGMVPAARIVACGLAAGVPCDSHQTDGIVPLVRWDRDVCRA